MEEKYVGVGSTVTYISLDDKEFNQVKIVDVKRADGELLKDSKVGEALMFGKEGEIVSVNIDEPYDIQIISILNPVKKEVSISKILGPSGDPVLVEDFVLADTANYANFESSMANGLKEKCAYGTRAKDIYEEGCAVFGWNYSNRGYFCSQKLLHAKKSTKEGFSVWFLTYSNLNTGSNKNANWVDYISADFNTVKEVWKKIDERFYNDFDIRLTFARQKDGKYIYIGIFQADETDEENSCKTYHRIEKDYMC